MRSADLLLVPTLVAGALAGCNDSREERLATVQTDAVRHAAPVRGVEWNTEASGMIVNGPIPDDHVRPTIITDPTKLPEVVRVDGRLTID